MLPKKELFRRFEDVVEIEIDGEVRVFEWLNLAGRFWFRPHNAPVQLLWVCFVDLNVLQSTPIRNPHGQGRGNRVVDMIWPSLRRGRFFRYACVPKNSGAPSGSWVALRLGGSCVVLPGERQRANWNVVFPWPGEREAFLHAPLDVLEAEVERAISNAPQEWQEAVAWAQMDGEARFWSLVSWKRGGELEWKFLVRALLQLELHRKPRQDNFGWEVFAMDKPRFAFGPLRMTKHLFMNQGFAPSVWQLLEVVEEHFGAKINYSRYRGFMPPFSSSPRNSTLIRASCPSHHELMQALDLWRDFGRRSNQLARVEELLRELLG